MKKKKDLINITKLLKQTLCKQIAKEFIINIKNFLKIYTTTIKKKKLTYSYKSLIISFYNLYYINFTSHSNIKSKKKILYKVKHMFK